MSYTGKALTDSRTLAVAPALESSGLGVVEEKSVPALKEGTSSPPRNLAFDVIRGFAVMAVVMSHFFNYLERPEEGQSIWPWFEAVRYAGWIGVPVFFVLSGYLIGSLLLREHAQYGRIEIKRFLLRRGFKIYPVFYLVVAIYLAYKLASGEEIETRKLLHELFFLQNYNPGGFLNVTWSLAVEEHFYFLFAALLAVGQRFWVRSSPVSAAPTSATRTHQLFGFLPALAVFLVMFCLAMRLWDFEPWKFGDRNVDMLRTQYRIDALFVGAAMAYLMWAYPQSVKQVVENHWRPLTVLTALIFCLATLPETWLTRFNRVTWYYILLSFGSAWLVAAAMHTQRFRGKFGQAMAFIGRQSYATYLIHILIFRGLMKAESVSGILMPLWLRFIVGMVLGLTAGAALTYLVETPMLRLRDRLVPARAKLRVASE